MNQDDRKNRKSIINTLEERGATTPDFLCHVSTELEKIEHGNKPNLACMFQLPFPILLNDNVVKLKGKLADIRATTFFYPRQIIFDKYGNIKFLEHHSSSEAAYYFTQVLMFIPYWGKRLEHYDKYSSCVEESGLKNRLIVPKHLSWVTVGYKKYAEPMPISSADYEFNLAWRIHRECHFAIGKFLIEYSRMAKVEARCPESLYNFFIMPTSGRVCYSKMPKPILAGIIGRPNKIVKETVSIQKLKRRLQAHTSAISPYEQQLIFLKKVYDDGEAVFCLIGIISLIEWLFNAHFFPAIKRQHSLSTLLKQDELGFIKSKHRATLENAIAYRNASIHGPPPTREALFIPEEKKQKLQSLPNVSAAKSKLFFAKLFETASEVYRDLNKSR